MWKKVLVACIALVGTFSVGYAMNQEMGAASNGATPTTGITARINQAPSGLTTSATTGFKVGDKIAMKAGDNNNSWLLLEKDNYTDYMKSTSDVCHITQNQTGAVQSCNNAKINGWYARTTNPITSAMVPYQIKNVIEGWGTVTQNTTLYGRKINATDVDFKNQYFYYQPYSYTTGSVNIPSFETKLKASKDIDLVTYRNLQYIHACLANPIDCVSGNSYAVLSNYPHVYTALEAEYDFNNQEGKHIFLEGRLRLLYQAYHPNADSGNLLNSWQYYVSMQPYNSPTWMAVAYGLTSKSGTPALRVFENATTGNGNTLTTPGDVFQYNNAPTAGSLNVPFYTTKAHHRANAYLDLEQVVFASSQNGTGSDTVTIPTDLSSSTWIARDANSADMIARIYKTGMNATISNLYRNGKNEELPKSGGSYQVYEGNSIDVAAIANIDGGSVVSAFLFDKNTGNLKYYFQNIRSATGSTTKYTLDMSSIPQGAYQLAIVNEQLPTTDAPTSSSKLSNVVNLDIVKYVPLSITYTNTLNSLVYGSNEIKANMAVGYITATGGVSPYTYDLIADSSGSNGHEYFKLASSENANGTLSVLINGTKAPNGLPAGTYKFTITALDAEGLPVDGSGKSTAKADVTITINKAPANIEFVDPSTRNEPYVSSGTFSEMISYSNTDISDANFKISYSTNNGIIDAQPDGDGNAFITMNSNGITGNVVLTAHLAETANFRSAFTTKTIAVYDGLKDLKFTPSKTPITTVDTQNGGFIIGKVSLDGGVANYTYSIENNPLESPDSVSFSIDSVPTTAKVMTLTTNGKLSAGTYRIKIKVVDAYAQTKYLPVAITVSPASQTGFEFYDYQDNSILTGSHKQIEYGTKGAMIIAAGGQGTGAISYRIKNGEDTSIFDIDSKGVLTIHKTGSVKVEAVKAGDTDYNEAVIEMTIDIIDAKQTLVFDTNIPAKKKFVENATLAIPASLTRTDGSAGRITYSSTTPVICSLDDSEIALITMKAIGNCIVKASNNDLYYEAKDTTKTIQLYDGISGTFIQTVDPLRQGDKNAQAGSTTAIAKVTSLMGGDGIFNFTAITVLKNGVNVSEIFQMDSFGNITPKQNLPYGSYDVTITITDGNNESSTILGVINIGLEANASFKVTHDGLVATSITSDFVSAQNPKIMLSTQGKKGSGAVHFRLSEDSLKDPNEMSEAISIDDTGVITVNRAMTAQDVYKVYAYIDEDPINGLAKQITPAVLVTIEKSPQAITFDSTVPSSVKYVLDKTFAINATLDRSDGEITYSSTTPSICVVEDSENAIAKVKDNGKCIIKAENNDKNYISTNKTTSITIYNGMSASFLQTIDPLNQGDAALDPTTATVIGKVTSLVGNQGNVQYTHKVIKDSVDVSNHFTINAQGELIPAQTITYGVYDVEVTMEDDTGAEGVVTISGQIIVGLEGNTAFKIIQDGAIVMDITSDYVTAQNPKITLSTQGRKGTGAVSYHFSADSQKDPNKQTEAITLDEATGIITVHRAMTSSDTYKVYASIEEDTTNGYAMQTSQIVTLQIDPSPQSITFDASVSGSLKFVKDKTFAINASLDRSDGSIIYTSTTPSICTVEDNTKPIATMVSIGECVIQAENSDENYVKASKTKEITLFDGMTATFTQVVTPVKQGDSKLDPATQTILGKITNLAGNQGEVQYSLKVMKGLVDVSADFEINANGEVLPKSIINYGTYHVEVTLVDDTGDDGSIIVQGSLLVELEENTELKITYNALPTIKIEEAYADVKTGFSVGVTNKKGSGKVHYHLSDDSHKDPSALTEAITVNDDGTILVHRVMSEQDVYKIYASVEENTMQGYAEQISNTVPIYITTADMGELSWLVDGVAASELHETYAPNKKVQLDIRGKITGSTITYSLIPVDGLTIKDVVKVDEQTGEVEILHANLTSQIGQVQIQAVVSCAGYADKKLPPLNVQIDKAEQTEFKFSQNIYVMPYGTGSFTPEFLHGAPHEDKTTYNNKLSCFDPYDVRVEATRPDTFLYNVTEAEGASITIKARNLGNRDYKAKEATAILKVLGENESLFDVTVSPSPVIRYGEDVTILPDIPESDTVFYIYESMDDAILLQDEHDANIFHSQKVGTVQIKVTKKETGAQDAVVYVSVRVKPKEIKVELDNTYEIKTGQAIPLFALKDMTKDLVNEDVLPTPDIRVAIANTDTAGTYPITVTYPNDAITSNYSFQQVPSNLTIIQDEPEDNWYKIYKESDPTKSVIDTKLWYNEPLAVESIHGDYTDISLNGLSNWSSTQKLDVEGIYTTPVYFKDMDTNAFTSAKDVTVKLDYKKPIIKSMTGTIVDQTGLWKILHDITFGTFFKPKTSVIIHVDDPKEHEHMEVSGVKSIQYKVYLADETNDTLTPLITNGNIFNNDIRDNKAAIVLHDSGKYYVCANAIDFAGNAGEELCSYLNIKGKGDDSDGDGIPDLNIDSDGDGEPELNITKDPKDKLPYTNIDTNGDGIADTNIDLDGDGTPDLNIGIVHEWNPYIEVDIDNDGVIDFKTGSDIPWERNIDSDNDKRPDINVDVDKDGIADINIDTDNDFSKPEINIDNKGDGMPHINVDDNEDGKPDRNIVIFTKWEPKDDVKGNILYDTMYNLKANDTLVHEETKIVVESPPDYAFLPNNALKVEDQTKEKADQIQSELSDKLSDTQMVEQVYRISIINEFGEETPVQDVLKVRIPMQKDVRNPIIYLTKKNGSFVKVDGSVEDGYFVFETDELGLLSIIANREDSDMNDQNPLPPNDDADTPKDADKPSTDVQGSYTDKPTIHEQTTTSIGGAYTGDTTNCMLLVVCSISSFVCLLFVKRNYRS